MPPQNPNVAIEIIEGAAIHTHITPRNGLRPRKLTAKNDVENKLVP